MFRRGIMTVGEAWTRWEGPDRRTYWRIDGTVYTSTPRGPWTLRAASVDAEATWTKVNTRFL